MKRQKSINIQFGALARPLWAQTGCDTIVMYEYQKDATAIVRLSVRGLLTEAQVDMARRKLLKKIVEAMEEK